MAYSPGFLKLVDDARRGVREVSIDETRTRLANKDAFQLVDVREDREWTMGHIIGAQHMARGILEREIEKKIPDKDAEIILYCGGGYRSVLSAESLMKMGYTNVASMAGGWRGWKAVGGPAT